jgi:hypothetical protein
MKERKTPLRTCVGCSRETDKRELVRVVRSPQGEVGLDPSGKANGRGAYVCANPECFEAAARKRRFGAALKVVLTEDDIERLRRDYERTITGRSSTGR